MGETIFQSPLFKLTRRFGPLKVHFLCKANPLVLATKIQLLKLIRWLRPLKVHFLRAHIFDTIRLVNQYLLQCSSENVKICDIYFLKSNKYLRLDFGLSVTD